MIKRLLLDSEYTITSSTTILIDSNISFKASNLSLILVTTDNRIVYNFACDDLKASISGQVITLVDTTVNLDDSLTIIMSFEEGSTIEVLNSISFLSSKHETLLQQLIELQKENNKYLKKIYSPI